MKRLLLIDTLALFHRSHSALIWATGGMTTPTGEHVTGTYGTLNALFSILGGGNYDCIIPCTEGGNNWRKRESSEYKGNRGQKEPSFYSDLSLLTEEIFPALGLNTCRQQGFEADDVIAHISRNSPAYDEIHILSCDSDLLQLVTNKVRVILFNSAKSMKIYGIDEVLEKYGVYPSEISYMKALAGDSSDNVAGISGVGNKTAAKIISECRPTEINPEFTGADRIIMHPRVKEHATTFLSNLRLVCLNTDVTDLKWFASSPPAPSQVEALFTSLGFKSFLKRLPKILSALGSTPLLSPEKAV